MLRKSLGQYESAISAANRDVYIGLGFGAALLLSPIDEVAAGGYILLKVGGKLVPAAVKLVDGVKKLVSRNGRTYDVPSGADRINAENIANGHAWIKHQDEFKHLGITNEQQFADHIENIINTPTQFGRLTAGRSYAYDANSNTIVIQDQNSPDGGTAFVIDSTKFPNPQDYIDTLR